MSSGTMRHWCNPSEVMHNMLGHKTHLDISTSVLNGSRCFTCLCVWLSAHAANKLVALFLRQRSSLLKKFLMNAGQLIETPTPRSRSRGIHERASDHDCNQK